MRSPSRAIIIAVTGLLATLGACTFNPADNQRSRWPVVAISAPESMATDLSSVSRIAWSIVNRVGPHLEASLLYDWLDIACRPKPGRWNHVHLPRPYRRGIRHRRSAARLRSALSYATVNIYADGAMPADESPLTILLGMSVATLIMVTPLMLVVGIPFAFFRTGALYELALLAASLLHLVAYASLLYLIRHAGPVFASQVSYVVTLAGVFWGMLIFSEVPSVWVWAALALALAGLALARPRGYAQPADTSEAATPG